MYRSACKICNAKDKRMTAQLRVFQVKAKGRQRHVQVGVQDL